MSIRSMHRSICVYISALTIPAAVCGCRISHVAPAAATAPQAVNAPSATVSVAQARQALANAAFSLPADPSTQLELALFDLKTNAPDIAEREMIACWKRFPHYGRAPYQLGMFYLTHGRNQDAVPCLGAAAAASQNDAQVQWSAGLACFQTGDVKRALVFLKRAIAIDPQAPEPYLLEARCYDHPGTASLGIASLHQYLKRAANPSPGYYLLGRLYSRQADRTHAEEWLRRAVEAEPEDAEYWVGLGRVYFELSNATQAARGIECYEKALALDPNNWAAHQYLGHALLDKQQYEAAIPHLRAALQSGPEPGPRYYDLSQALLKAGHLEEGRKALTTFQAYREFQTGLVRLNRAIVAAPNDRSKRYALVRFCLDHRQITAAQSVLEEIARQPGRDAELQRLQDEVRAGRANSAAPSRLPPATRPSGLFGQAPPAAGDAGSAAAPGGSKGFTMERGADNGR